MKTEVQKSRKTERNYKRESSAEILKLNYLKQVHFIHQKLHLEQANKICFVKQFEFNIFLISLFNQQKQTNLFKFNQF